MREMAVPRADRVTWPIRTPVWTPSSITVVPATTTRHTLYGVWHSWS
jgi:hypothetical protein